jgi:transcriptional regulator with XRE-family HTH domain
MEESKSNIEEQLREAIAESELSNYQISDNSGVSKAQLSLFVNRKRTLTLAAAAKIAEALGLEFKKQHKKKETIIMSGRKKPEAEKIQYRISHRLSKLHNEGKLKKADYDFLWKWTHELYELALNVE